MDLITWLYKPSEPGISGTYDLVIPLDYGTLTTEKLLPKATRAGLDKAAAFLRHEVAEKIAWAGVSRFGASLERISQEKVKLLEAWGLPSSRIQATVDCTNSITEAERILALAPTASRVIVICDWRHARRARRIWRHFFKGEFIVLTTDEVWDEQHMSFWCRSDLRWFIGNLIHHILLLIVGVDRLRKVVHPISNQNT